MCRAGGGEGGKQNGRDPKKANRHPAVETSPRSGCCFCPFACLFSRGKGIGMNDGCEKWYLEEEEEG